jgi:carbamoyltransferase
MRILGINISHHPSVCQLTDGQVDFYFEEERFNRKKYSLPPFKSGKFICLEKHLKQKPDYVVYTSWDRSIPLGIIPKSNKEVTDEQIINETTLQIEKLVGEHNYIFELEHHLYHVYCGYYFSKFDDAICIVMDGGGAKNVLEFPSYQEIESIYYIDKSKCIARYKAYSDVRYSRSNTETVKHINGIEFNFSSRLSSGMKFSQLSEEIIGTSEEAGKVMGLASYGDLNGTKQEDKARILQEETKNHTIELIRKAISYSDTKNIILSGGYALNCVNNYEYLKHFPEYNFFVDPAANDTGTSIGAALWLERTLHDN